VTVKVIKLITLVKRWLGTKIKITYFYFVLFFFFVYICTIIIKINNYGVKSKEMKRFIPIKSGISDEPSSRKNGLVKKKVHPYY
jgi:uncharacterized metal-binding protein